MIYSAFGDRHVSRVLLALYLFLVDNKNAHSELMLFGHVDSFALSNNIS